MTSIVLLTGATGFVGKVVLEELLRRRAELGVERVLALVRARDLERMQRAARVDRERLGERQRELDRRRAVDHVRDLRGDARARRRREAEPGPRHVSRQRLDARLPAARVGREARRRGDVRAQPRRCVLGIARAHEREHALDTELRAAPQQLLEHDLADEAGRAGEQHDSH